MWVVCGVGMVAGGGFDVGGGELALITTVFLDNAVLFDSYMKSFKLFGHVSS